MNVRYNLATSSVVTGNGVSSSSWSSGYVCVDMTGISSGDSLTAQITANGANTNMGNFDWTTNGWSNIGNASSLTVPASAITAGQIVLRADLMSTITSGATYDVNIKKGAVEVSKSCAASPATVAPTVSVSGSGMGGATFTATFAPVAGALDGYGCYVYDANNVERYSNWCKGRRE